jgi:SAM-dependent methyltransferase
MAMNKILQGTSKLAEAFKHHKNQDDAWEALWQANTTPWDRGAPNPALEDALVQRSDLLGTAIIHEEGREGGDQSSRSQRRKKALVPGCGRGVDVFLLATFGYVAYGLDCSETALKASAEEVERVRDSLRPRYPEIGMGSYTFLQGDFFSDDWLKKAGLTEDCFDLIYDYTVS